MLAVGIVTVGIVSNWGLVSGFVRMSVHPLQIEGTVVDAKTGGPIEGLEVLPGSPIGDDYAWASADRGTHYPVPVSQYEMEFRKPLNVDTGNDNGPVDLVLRFSAPGYTTLVSRPFRPFAGKIAYSVVLQPAVQLTGHVFLPNGTAAAGLPVYILSKVTTRSVFLEGTKVGDWNDVHPVTDLTGAFHYTRPPGDFALLAADSEGFGIMLGDPAATGSRIVLQKWGRIEGRWRNQGHPMSAVRLSFSAGAQWGLSFFRSTVTPDADGRFVFEDVPPGPFSLYWAETAPGHGSGWPTELTSDEIQPGEQKHLDYSTSFRKVTGKMEGDSTVGNIDFAACNVVLSPRLPETIDRPAGLDTPALIKEWQAAWGKTEEGRATRAVERNRRQIHVSAHGTFTSDWVAPGKYSLRATLEQGNRTLAKIEVEQVDIPPGETSFDLGKFALAAVDTPYLRPGDRTPDFTVPNLDSGSVKLAALHGKFVLLDFWATDCGPCVEEIAHLREAYKRFGGNGKFAMVGLDMDAKADTAKRFVHASNMPWLQGYLKAGWANPVARAYGIDGIPTIILLSPDGRIIARDLRGEDIAAAIEEKLPRN